jgi:arylsulfatase A-like enzyme
MLRSALFALLLAPSVFAARPNILLVVLDPLRYDATQKGNMPFLGSLATRGVVFTNAYSTHDFTPPSHFSMMTGLKDGLATDEDRVENSVPYQLRRAGYDTFATATNNLLAPVQMPTFRAFANFRQPGDINAGTFADEILDLTDVDMQLAIFRCRPTPHARAKVYFSADRLLPMFLDQVQHAHAPYFGFVNLIDTHEPYIPDSDAYRPEQNLPPGFNGDVLKRRLGPRLLLPDAEAQKKIAEAGAASLTTLDLSPEAIAIYHNRYNAIARELDGSLSDFFDALEGGHLLSNTVVIITSDHGESFGEDNLITHMFHDRGDYESTHHVPLIVIFPRTMNVKPAVIDRKVSIASIAPTIYELAGLDRAPLKERYPDYPLSLLRAAGVAPMATIAQVMLPTPAKQDHSEAERERQKSLLSLGYVH